jgi:streptogramin lyase
MKSACRNALSNYPRRIAAAVSRIGIALMVMLLSGIHVAAHAQTITEFDTPNTPGFALRQLTGGPDGNVWYTKFRLNPDNGFIGRIKPTGVATEFEVLGIRPAGITAGSDGNLWFGTLAASIGRITPSGAVTIFPSANTPFTSQITAGPDGNVWFTYSSGIGRITPAGVVTEFTADIEPSTPISVTAGPDGNLWFISNSNDPLTHSRSVNRITPAGVVTRFTTIATADWDYITAGPDGNLWFTDGIHDNILRVTTAGVATRFGYAFDSNPHGIVAGPEGNLWTADTNANRIGRITFTAAGFTAFTFFSAGITPASDIRNVAAGPDDNIWFTESATNRIGRVNIAVPATVTVTKPGSGSGSVTSNIGAINCGAICSDLYPKSTVITLNATPAPGSQFTGWLGPCTGSATTCEFHDRRIGPGQRIRNIRVAAARRSSVRYRR